MTSDTHTTQSQEPAVPEIDYEALIHAAFAKNDKWAQGTAGCIAFSRGAEWFRDQMLAAAPSQEPVRSLTVPDDLPGMWDRADLSGGETDAAPSQPVTPDPGQWCQYVAGMIFCWLQMQEGLGLSDNDEDRFVEAIAGIIQRRLWAYKPSQGPASLTEDKTSAS